MGRRVATLPVSILFDRARGLGFRLGIILGSIDTIFTFRERSPKGGSLKPFIPEFRM